MMEHVKKDSNVWYCVGGAFALGAGAALAFAHVYQPSFCQKKPKGGKKYHLKYWNGRGLMEVPRTMLALRGMDYVDGRYTTEAAYGNTKNISEIKDTLDWNLGRMPTMTVNDSIHIGQSQAINIYLAQELDLMGDSNEEAGQIISILEHIRELLDARPWSYGETPSAEQLKEFFESGPTASTGVADMKTRTARRLPWYLNRLEELVGGSGYAVGSRFSLADAVIFNTFGELLADNQAPASVAQFKREPLQNLAKSTKALAAHPKVKKIVDTFRADKGVAQWLQTRGEQKF